MHSKQNRDAQSKVGSQSSRIYLECWCWWSEFAFDTEC